MFKSIRSRIFLAFFALTLVIAGVGGYGIFEIWSTGRAFGDFFDKPLMAINYARLASLDFAQMNNERLRQQLAGTSVQADRTKLDGLTKAFFDDLGVARERGLTKRAADAIDQINDLGHRWDDLRKQVDFASATGATAAAADSLSDQVIDKFDTLVEETTGTAFVQREDANNEFKRYLQVSIGATIAALLSSLVVALALTRRIVRPLTAAAAVANRVAGGDFQTVIPHGGTDETGMLLRSMSVMQANIHEMMEREAAQRRSAQNRLIDAVEGSHEGMLLVDGDGKIVMVNSQTAEFFPSIAGDLVSGSPCAATFRKAREKPEDILTAEAWLKLLAADGEIELANGRWLRVSSSATQEGGHFLSLSDITPIKEREESLRAARQAAEAASVAKSNFVANMGHELRTPLNAVIGFSEIIAGEQFGPVGTKEYVEYAGDILASGRHLLAIINDVLDLAKSTDGKLHFDAEPVDLDTIVDDCARLVADQCAAGGLTLNIEPEEIGLGVWGEEAKLRQILLNLLSNAIKFSPAGGTVTVSSRTAAGDMVDLIVADTGIGMRPEDIKVALEPFGQIDSALARRYEGTGLGLPLTRALTELHGGRLEIDSEPGHGTRIHVVLRACHEGISQVQALAAVRVASAG